MDEATGYGSPLAPVAGMDFVAFTSDEKGDQVSGRLVLRRIPDLGNLIGATGAPGGGELAGATSGTIGRKLTEIAAEVVSSARRLILHLPRRFTSAEESR